MTREDRAIALLGEANPVPDLDRYALDPARRLRLDDVEQWSNDMTDTKLRQLDAPDSGRPRLLVGALAALAILVVGIAAYLVIQSDGSDDEVATTVPPTQMPSITYTGLDCIYDGPGVFTMADDMTFAFTNASEVFGGTTLYPVGPAMTVPNDGAYPIWIRDEFYGVDIAPGESVEFTATPSEPGRWMIVCGTDSDNATIAVPNLDRYATILEVTP